MNIFGVCSLFAVPVAIPASANGVPETSSNSIAPSANEDESAPDATGIA